MTQQSVQYVKPVITGCIGGIAGALVVGGFHLAANLYDSTGHLGTLMTGNGAFRYLIDMAVAFVTAFLLSWILFRWERKAGDRAQTVSKTVVGETKNEQKWRFMEEIPFLKKERRVEKVDSVEQDKNTKMETGVVYSPLQGQVIPMEDVPDDTFAAKVLGEGMAVIPSEGMVWAPFDGKVVKVYDTKHAICISSLDDIELLIHIGINTEESGGNFFQNFVSDGDWISRGEPLLRFDIAAMKEAGYSTVTPVIVTNSDDYNVVHLLGNGMVDQQDVLMKV